MPPLYEILLINSFGVANSISFVVNGELLKGRTIVCFESVLYEDKLLAIHAEIYDENQTIYSPEIKTEAKGSKYLGHV